MKRIVSLGLILLALGSCQSDNAPTQPESAADQVSVSARLVASKALPVAQRFRARMTVGDAVGEWSDAKYDKGTQLNLGKVKRGTLVVLDVRGYSLAGNDTVWKWFARASDSAKGSVLSIVGVVEAIESPVVAKGQPLVLPAGSWYTTDASSWSNPSRVDATGAIPALTGTFVRVRLRMAVPGTKDTLLGDTLRLTLPQKPTILPADHSLAKTDSVKVSGAGGDSLVVCEGANCSNWAPYKNAYPAKAFVLRARAWRDGLVSAIETATFTLADAPVDPVDTVVGMPSFSPKAGTVASTDKISITPAKSGDSIRFTTNGKDWNGYSAPFAAGAFTVRAVALRGKYVSDTAEAAYTVSSTKPSSPSITSSCAEFRNCDPGTTFEVKSAESGVTLWYALFPSDSMDWKKYEAKVPLASSSKVFVRAVRGTDTSAVQTQYIAIVPPDTVAFAQARRNADTVWVTLATTSGTIWYTRGASRDSVTYTDAIAVRVHDSLRAWSVRGTARSAAKTFRAVAERPKPPKITSPRDSVIALKDSIVLEAAAAGDTLQVWNGDSWEPHAGRIAPGKGGVFTITARSRRNGLVSDSVTKTYYVDTAMLASPTISPATFAKLDPGTEISISAGSGSMLQCSTAISKKWDSVSSPLKFAVDKDTTIFARAKTDRKFSAIQTFVITVQQPGAVTFEESERYPDSVKLVIEVVDGDTVLYSRNSETTPSKASVPGTFTITVQANDSITAWTRRGTAYGVKSGYRMVPVAPKAPTISPAGRHVHDTTLIALSAADTGDSLSYKIGSKGTWTKYVDRLHLPAGVDTLFARASRNSLIQDTSAIFTVHSSPGKPRISGCTVNCDPGSELAFTSASGYDIHVKVGDTGYAKLESPFRKTMVASADVCAYSDSSGHRSADSCVTVNIKQPVPPEITAVKAVHFADYDSAYVTVTVSQPGDTLHAQFGKTELLPSKRVSTSGAFTVSFEIKRQDAVADSVLEIWTKRGTATSSSVTYTLSRLPPPTATLPESTYVVGKTFSFARDRPAGALNSDTIQISTDSGKTWTNLSSLSLPKTTQVWARTARTGYGGVTDRSRVFKVTYTLDSTLLTRISLTTSDSVKQWFDVTQTGTVHSMEVSDEVTSLVVDFQGRIGEIDQFIYRCDNCTDKNDAFLTGGILSVNLQNITTDYFTFTMKAKGGLVRTYKIAVRRTAPWNPNVTYDSIEDSRDGAVYRTVKIGTRTWMAENLRFKGTGASPLGNCREYDSTQCQEFGRYYNWAEAMSLGAGCNTASCAADVLPSHQGICPEGFHVPSQTDWEAIAADLGVTLESVALAMRLRSKSYWKGSPWDGQTGPFDGMGFRVFPTGLHETNGEFMYFGGTAYFWSTQESSKANEASTFMFGTFYNEQSIALGVAQMLGYGKVRGQSLRCVK